MRDFEGGQYVVVNIDPRGRPGSLRTGLESGGIYAFFVGEQGM